VSLHRTHLKLISDFSLEENSLNFNPNDNSVVISVNIIALILVCLINKVYNDYNSKGLAKKQDLMAQKQHENESLVNELSLLRQQLEAIKTQIADKENKLSVIDVKYAPMISEVDSKIGANEMAKNQIVQSIEQVKSGIINNIK
jgi:hypothetical protein